MQYEAAKEKRRRFRGWALGALAICGIACLLCLTGPGAAQPGGSREGHPQLFLSGGERSVLVLREIKEVLERIDSRLQRIEDRLSRIDQAGPASQPVRPAATLEHRRESDR